MPAFRFRFFPEIISAVKDSSLTILAIIVSSSCRVFFYMYASYLVHIYFSESQDCFRIILILGLISTFSSVITRLWSPKFLNTFTVMVKVVLE